MFENKVSIQKNKIYIKNHEIIGDDSDNSRDYTMKHCEMNYHGCI